MSNQKVQSKRTCTIPGCERRHEARGYCPAHYAKFRRHGDPLAGQEYRPRTGLCNIDGCEKEVTLKGWCLTHYERWRRKGDPLWLPPEPQGTTTQAGYRVIRVNKKAVLEHRWVMQQIIGRELLPEETVHHVNGVRNDNRPENLELWSSSHPRGQRVQDKVDWAEDLLRLYAPHLLAEGGPSGS